MTDDRPPTARAALAAELASPDDACDPADDFGAALDLDTPDAVHDRLLAATPPWQRLGGGLWRDPLEGTTCGWQEAARKLAAEGAR